MIEIDKHKIYESHGYKFINFVDLTIEQKEMILSWRNHEKVRSMMVNKDPISLDNHIIFIDSLKDRTDCYYWLVKDPLDVEVGVFDIIHVDYTKDEGEIGFYINPNEAGKGFEFMIECNYFAYSQLKLGNNLSTVNVNNKDILLFTKYIGSSFERIEKIGNDYFYVNKHGRGDYLIKHYSDFKLKNYARFVKKNRNNENIFIPQKNT